MNMHIVYNKIVKVSSLALSSGLSPETTFDVQIGTEINFLAYRLNIGRGL